MALAKDCLGKREIALNWFALVIWEMECMRVHLLAEPAKRIQKASQSRERVSSCVKKG